MQDSVTAVVHDRWEELPDSVLEAIPLGIAVIDSAGSVRSLNRQALELLGVTDLDELHAAISAGSFALLDPSHHAVASDEVADVLLPRTPTPETEYRFIHDRHEERSVVVSATAFGSHSNLVVYQDVTEQRGNRAYHTVREHLLGASDRQPLSALLTLALDEAERLTDSEVAFFLFLDDGHEAPSRYTLSTATEARYGTVDASPIQRAEATAVPFRAEKLSSAPTVHNDYSSLENGVGLFPPSVPVVRELVAPVVRSGRVVALLGVGNKPRRYSSTDIRAIQLLADLAWSVAERKRAEEHLFQTNTALSGSLNAVVVTDANLTIDYVNPAFLRLFRLTDEDCVHRRSLLDFWQSPLLARSVFEEMLTRGYSAGELFGKRADDREFLVEFSGSGVRSPSGETLGLFATFIDVTDYHRVRSGLRDAEEKFTGAFHVIGDAIHICDFETGRFLEVNEGFSRMVGYKRAEAIGKTALDLNLWDTLADREAYFAILAKQGHVHGLQARYRTKDGHLLWVEHSAEFLQLSGRRCVVTITRDITAQRASAHALEESELRFRSMFDLHDAPMLLIDPKSAAIRCANAAAQRYFEVSSDALLERRLYELCSISRRDTTRLLDATTRGAARSFQMQHRSASGELREAEVFASPIPHLGNTLLFAILHDTTEKRKLEEQFRRVQRMDCLGNLAGGVAHDINNVLSAILSHAAVQRELASAGSQLADDLDTITQACIRGRNLVKSLLDFARPTLAEQKTVHLNEIVTEEVRLLSRTTLNRALLRLELDPHLGAIRGDASALSHALMNLCINAVDAMPEGGTLTIATSNVGDNKVRLEVRDTGLGMTPEVLEKATDPFFSTKPQGKGTGLGLPMVYGAAEAHAAQFEITSQPGRGTRVRLTFPKSDAPIDDAPESGQVAWNPSTLSILVVDDDWMVLRGLSRQLVRLGHRVTPCARGQDALAFFEKPHLFDLVVLDVNMPEIGGCDVFNYSRKLGSNCPVLFVTGRPDESLQQFIADHPGTTMLAKPFTQAELQTALRELCGRARNGSLTPTGTLVRETRPHSAPTD